MRWNGDAEQSRVVGRESGSDTVLYYSASTQDLYIEIVIHLAMAFSGGYVLARTMAMGRVAAVVSAVVFPSSSWLYLHLSVGHMNFLPALYIPWIVALFLIFD